MPELNELLGRWHQWRRAYSVERGYARLSYAPTRDDDALEALQMQSIEDAVAALPRTLQVAIQHVARMECLGVEVLIHPALHNRELRTALVEHALRELQRRLQA